MSDDDGVLAGSWRDGEFDLRVGGGKFGQDGLDELAATCKHLTGNRIAMDLLHAPGAAGPVTVVQVHLLALKDKGTQAILEPSVSPRLRDWGKGNKYVACSNGS